DDRLRVAGLEDGKVGGLGAFEDATGIDADLTKRIRELGSVAHQPADLGILTLGIGRRNSMAHRLVGNVDAPAGEESSGTDEEGVDLLAHKGRESRVNFAAGAGVDELDL